MKKIIQDIKMLLALSFPFLFIIGVILANLGILAVGVWVVVKVLQAMGVL